MNSAAWQVTLCDPIWHVSSRSGVVLVAQTAIRFLPYQSACATVLMENSSHGGYSGCVYRAQQQSYTVIISPL